MLKRLSIFLVFGALAAGLGPVMAADANSDQIYNALRAGRTAEAEQMINQVLRDYPRNAKAHYVAAEVYARAGDYSRARAELSTAQILDPSGGFANPRSIQELQTQLNGGARRVPGYAAPGFAAPARRSSVPWGLIIVLVAVVAIIWMLAARRRNMYAANYPTGVPGAPGAPGGAYPYGPGPGYGPGGAPFGGGSGLMGSLGTGLAVGAGVAAGEELTRHVLGGSGGGVIPSAEAGEPVPPPANEDMGGQNFGVNDPGSWDDGGGGGGGGDWGGGGGDGGGDWT
jgi:uncharacterized protein